MSGGSEVIEMSKATYDAKQSIEFGTNIVGGVKPGKDGEHLGLPVLPNMRAVSEDALSNALLAV